MYYKFIAIVLKLFDMCIILVDLKTVNLQVKISFVCMNVIAHKALLHYSAFSKET